MKSGFAILAATLLCPGLFALPARAAARQYVVIVAEGLSPKVLDLGKNYLRVADDDAEVSTSFDDVMESGKSATAEADSLAQLGGLLATARQNGYKTGLVTTGDLVGDAQLFYALKGDAAAAITSSTAPYDFIAGGGRAKLGRDAGAKIKASGGTFLRDEASLDDDLMGRVVAAQADADLDYALDRDPEKQAGFAELSTLALDTLGAGDQPFVLVIYDTLLEKALETKDSPALMEEFREINAVLDDVSARRDDNPNLGIALLMTGGAITPRFSTNRKNEQQNALRALSNLSLSYAGAGRALKGADADTIAEFADPEAGQYAGWKVSDEVRDGILAGTLDPETAIRAYFEPVLKLEYTAQNAAPVAYTLGFEAPDGIVAALKSAVGVTVK